MQANQDKIESLHQQAAAYYLQGEFDQALAYWQQLLEMDPEDERAQEGVRLCEMLADEGDLLAPSTVPVAAAEGEGGVVQSAHAEPTATAELDDEDLGWDLSKLDLTSTQVEMAPTVPTPPLVEPDAGLNALPDLETWEPQEADSGLDGLDAALDFPDAEAEMLPVRDAGAANELRARIDELVAEATAAYEAGDHETAMRVVSRVFILDEANDAALKLQQAMQPETDGPAIEPDFEPDFEPMGEPFDVDLDAKEKPHDELPDYIADPPAPLTDELETDAVPDPADIPMEGIDAIPDGVRAAQKLAAQAKPSMASSRRPWISAKFLALYAVGIVVALGIGWGVLQFLGRSPDPELDAAVLQMQALKKEQAARKDDPAPGKKGGEKATPVTIETVPELLARADASIVAGDFPKAIVAFNQVLEIEPDHRIAKAGLASAGERYREQRAFQEKMDTATTAWDRGDFRSAMRVFYRLPEATGSARFDRYKQHGWYNLGLQALNANNCTDAQGHFAELQQLAANAESAELVQLADNCEFSRSDPDYREQVAGLKLRALDD